MLASPKTCSKQIHSNTGGREQILPWMGNKAGNSNPFKMNKTKNQHNAMIAIKDLKPAASNTVNTRFIVLDKGKLMVDGGKRTTLSLVADETAAVHFQMWENECDVFQPGDIIQLTHGVFSYHKTNMILRAGKKGKAVKIGEFTMTFVETPNMSEIQWKEDPANRNQLVPDPNNPPILYSKLFPPMPN